MTSFTDAKGRAWTIELDALLLDDVRQETGIDLADLSAGGLAAIDQDAVKLVQVLCVLCGEEMDKDGITNKQFAKLMRGDALTRALDAVARSVQSFFPEKTWLEVQSAFENQKSFNQSTQMLKPLLSKLNQPEMEAMRTPVLEALTEVIQRQLAGGLDASEVLASVTGQDHTPSTHASDTQESAELVHAG